MIARNPAATASELRRGFVIRGHSRRERVSRQRYLDCTNAATSLISSSDRSLTAPCMTRVWRN